MATNDNNDNNNITTSLVNVSLSRDLEESTNEWRLPRISKEEYFHNLDRNVAGYRNPRLNSDEQAIVRNHLQGLSTGTAAAIPIYCAGSVGCPFADRCVLVEINKAPIGEPCFIESQLLNEFSKRYFEEFDVDANSMIEISFIRELAKLDILEMRVNYTLARPENSDMTMTQVTSVDRDNNPIATIEVSPYFELLERISNRRQKVIKLMVGDRQEKYKKQAALKNKDSDDSSSLQAGIRAKLQGLARAIDEATDNIQRKSSKAEPDSTNEIIQPLTPDDIINGEE